MAAKIKTTEKTEPKATRNRPSYKAENQKLLEELEVLRAELEATKAASDGASTPRRRKVEQMPDGGWGEIIGGVEERRTKRSGTFVNFRTFNEADTAVKPSPAMRDVMKDEYHCRFSGQFKRWYTLEENYNRMVADIRSGAFQYDDE